MTNILLIVALALLVSTVALLMMLLKNVSRDSTTPLVSRLEAFERAQERSERALREEVTRNRDEQGKAAKDQRQELNEAFKTFSDVATQRMMEISNVQGGQLTSFAGQLNTFANAQKAQLETMSLVIGKLTDSNEKKLEAIRVTVEGKLQSMQIENAKQLEQMRQTVDEKLQGTLEKRLGESFKQVSERLEQVHKGLGEMQTLATGVGDLKKVFSNVKTRGTWGEVQLGALLEQVLNPDQFATNVAIKGGSERVEFAIKLPGQGTEKDAALLLPIDAKFPIEDYQRLIDAQERADIEGMELSGKQLENRVKTCAKEISEKYLFPPKTTDFAILFLPTEGLFAEVTRRIGLIDVIRREYHVAIAGPTTLWSILNAFQMGFRTLAIQKRSSEVWNLLAEVKTEWMKYGDILDAVQKKLTEAANKIDDAKVRSRAIGKKLKDVAELPASDATPPLPQTLLDD